LRKVELSRSWFYDWRAGNQAKTIEMLAEANLVGQSRDILAGSGERYGALRMRAELRDRGIPIASKRVAQLMRLMQDHAKCPLRKPGRASCQPSQVVAHQFLLQICILLAGLQRNKSTGRIYLRTISLVLCLVWRMMS
jgi:aspartokinase